MKSSTKGRLRPSLRDVDRFFHIDWTWVRAKELYAEGDDPIRNYDTLWIRRTLRYLHACSDTSASACNPPTEDFADIVAARRVQEEGSLFRDILQAYLLTQLSFEDVAAHMGLTAAAVEAYEQVFFDVRSRLPHSGWIMTKAVDRPWNLYDGATIGQLLRKFGYFAGERVLDQLVAYLQKHQSASFSRRISESDLTEGEEKSIRRCLALEMLTLDQRSIVLLFREQVEMLSQQYGQPANSLPASPADSWLEHIEFVGDGSDLKAVLDPNWLPQSAVA